MSIIEQATRRLEELNRAGVAVPWEAAGLGGSDLRQRVEAAPRAEAASRAEAAPRAVPDLPPARPVPVRSVPVRTPESGFNSTRPVDVTLDLARLGEAGFLVPSQTRTVLAEEFRQIKRPLLKNARSKDAIPHRLGLIVVTSALPGEGKTFSAINLALSIATEIDLAVLLVDADVVRPDAMARLGVENRRGLLDLLVDESLDLDDLVLKTNVPKLSLLPSGRHNHLSTELLASASMEMIVRRLANEYPGQVVVFDAPPLLLTSEAKVLASRVGQVVVVVEAARTSRATIKEAFAAVENCPSVVSILNKSQEHTLSRSYNYDYYQLGKPK